MAKVFKVFYTDNSDNFGQKLEIAPSKRAVTKQYEEEQKQLLAYILKESGVPYADDNN